MPEPSLDLKANQKSSWYSRYWIYTPLIVCVLIMLPRLISPQFGLLDDGRSLTIAQGIVHGKWDLSWDVIAGRARPVYWAAFAFWYFFAGGHAIWYFLGNLIVFSATTFLLVRLVVMLGGSNLQAWLTGLVFTLSTPVIENVYTLSKGENFQVLLLVSAIGLVVMAVKSARGVRYWLLMICAALLMLVACFTKENTLVMLPISLVWWAIAWIGRVRHISSAPFVEKVTRWIMLSSLVSSLVFYIGRTLMLSSKILGVGQSSEFSFALSQILNSIVRWGGWMLRDYLWLLPMMLMVLVVCLLQRRWPRSGLWWLAGVWMVFWLGLYLPWHFALEYYLLPFAAGTAVLTGVMLVEIIDLVKQSGRIWRWMSGAALTLTTILLFATQANSFTDASIQLSQDAANSRVLEYVVENAPEGSLVMVNIQLANEYIEQMQLMLANFYHRPDLELVNYQGEDLSLLKTQSHATYFLLADLENQPKMTVRMGLDEPSLQVWNASVLPVLSSWHDVFQVTEDPHVLTVDFPRLLCSVIYRENYCSAGTGLVNYKHFHYQWSVYTP
jgi:hypothetical protein